MHHYSYCRFIWTRIGERSERSLSDVDGVSSFCGISGGVRISISSFIILLWYMKAHSSARTSLVKDAIISSNNSS